MNRLLYTIVFTKRFRDMRGFYADQLGLAVRHEEKDWVEFETGGVLLALHAMPDEKKQGVALRFEVNDIVRDRGAMAQRGVQFIDGVQDFPWGRATEFWDTEGNPVGLLQPREPIRANGAPVIDEVTLGCRQFPGTVAFYHEQVGLRVLADGEHRAVLDAGDARLVLHPMQRDDFYPPHLEQKVALTFRSDDLIEWVDDLRERGVRFAAAPAEEEFGLYAEAFDPDGYVVVLREPPAARTIEDELIEAYEDDDAPLVTAIRKPVQEGTRASLLIRKQGTGSQKRAKKQAMHARKEKDKALSRLVKEAKRVKLELVAPRGTGEAGAREKPKSTRDPKRAKAKPATGRLKKAERKVATRKKRAVARVSKKKPVKRAVTKKATRR